MLEGAAATANGRCAASTAASVSSIPAPQVCVVHAHSALCVSFASTGTWHVGMEPVAAGKGRATSWSRALYCEGDKRLFTACINAAAPATIGAEKLVPTLILSWSVYVGADGVVVPVSLAATIENRHGMPPGFTQLPPGAAMAAAGPRL